MAPRHVSHYVIRRPTVTSSQRQLARCVASARGVPRPWKHTPGLPTLRQWIRARLQALIKSKAGAFVSPNAHERSVRWRTSDAIKRARDYSERSDILNECTNVHANSPGMHAVGADRLTDRPTGPRDDIMSCFDCGGRLGAKRKRQSEECVHVRIVADAFVAV